MLRLAVDHTGFATAAISFATSPRPVGDHLEHPIENRVPLVHHDRRPGRSQLDLEPRQSGRGAGIVGSGRRVAGKTSTSEALEMQGPHIRVVRASTPRLPAAAVPDHSSRPAYQPERQRAPPPDRSGRARIPARSPCHPAAVEVPRGRPSTRSSCRRIQLASVSLPPATARAMGRIGVMPMPPAMNRYDSASTRETNDSSVRGPRSSPRGRSRSETRGNRQRPSGLVEHRDQVTAVIRGIAAQRVLASETRREGEVQMGTRFPGLQGAAISAFEAKRRDTVGFAPHLTGHQEGRLRPPRCAITFRERN